MIAAQTDVVLFGINNELSCGCYNPAQHNASTATFAKWYGISNDFERVRNLPLLSRLAAQGDTQWHIKM